MTKIKLLILHLQLHLLQTTEMVTPHITMCIQKSSMEAVKLISKQDTTTICIHLIIEREQAAPYYQNTIRNVQISAVTSH